MPRNRFDVNEELESPFDIRHFRRAMVYLGQHRFKMIASLVFSILSAVAGLVVPKLFQYAIDDVLPNKDYRLLWELAGWMTLSIVLSVLFATYRARIMTRVGQEIIYAIRRDLFNHLQRLSFQYFEDRPHGKILVRVVHYVNSVSDVLSNGLINFVVEIFSLIFILIFMFGTSVVLTLVVLGGLPILLILIQLLHKQRRRAWQEVSNKNANLNAYLQENIDGVKIVQNFVREEENQRTFGDLNHAYYKAWMHAQRVSFTVGLTVENVSVVVVALMYITGIAWFTTDVTTGVLIAMGAFAWRFWQPILNISNLYNSFINTISYLERIFETMDEPVTVDDKPNAKILPPIIGHVEFKNVTFTYDEKKIILENLSFKIGAGQSVALVGPTGAGKTTIVNVLSRFYNIRGGQILLDGHDIADCTLNSLRSQMGIMLQESFIFSGTIMDNVRFGKPTASDAEIIEACKVVCADDFIRELPEGYNTVVNERGSRLSQGQRQLVSFARTLLTNPRILILDEATSSIDARTEKLLQVGLQNLLKHRTSFIIAHRLSTIRNCDIIMYVSNRGVTEAGTHDELMAKKGDYYKLHNAQIFD